MKRSHLPRFPERIHPMNTNTPTLNKMMNMTNSRTSMSTTVHSIPGAAPPPSDVVTEQIRLTTATAAMMAAGRAHTRDDLAPAPDAVLAIHVIEGPSKGMSLALSATSGRVLVGTSGACHLIISRDRSVSRRHCALEFCSASSSSPSTHGSPSPALLKVTDLESTNGTWIDDTRVLEAYAVPGSFIRIGTTVLHVAEQQVASTATTSSSTQSRKRLPAASSFGRLLGASVAMRRIYPLLERLASSVVPVLIEGESGTGKELLAEVLHEKGPRAEAPFVVVDASSCGDVEMELFGTSDSTTSTSPCGAFHQARGGTLLIDHVSRLSIGTQAKLLRAMCSNPASEGGPRVIATSRRDLDKEVENGRFRDDLFYQLVVGRVELPPLRSRGEDIRLLADHFWRALDGTARASAQGASCRAPLPPEFLRRFDGHPWSHNVRELRAAVTRYAAIGEVDDERARDAATPPDGAPEHAFRWLLEQRLSFQEGKELLVSEFERVFVEKALKAHSGNVSRAAAASGLARRYFQVMRARISERA